MQFAQLGRLDGSVSFSVDVKILPHVTQKLEVVLMDANPHCMVQIVF